MASGKEGVPERFSVQLELRDHSQTTAQLRTLLWESGTWYLPQRASLWQREAEATEELAVSLKMRDSLSGDGGGAISRAGWRWFVLGGPLVGLVSRMVVMEAEGPSEGGTLEKVKPLKGGVLRNWDPRMMGHRT